MKKNVNLKITIGALVVVIAIFYLIFAGFNSAQAAYYLKVNEALNGQIDMNKYYRIEGKIDVTNAKFDGNSNPVVLKFQIYDADSADKKLTVIYNDVKPDNFNEATSAVVEGKFNIDGTFHAETLSLKCPSKYEQADSGQKEDGMITQFLKSFGLKK